MINYSPCLVVIIDDTLFINCGGSKVIVNNNEYEADTLELGPSNHVVSDS